jgi:hypothetical protein
VVIRRLNLVYNQRMSGDGEMAEKRIFISYSRKDAAFVRKLRKRLKALKLEIWQDVEDIEPGSNWPDTIDETLRGACVLLLVITQDSQQSQYVSYEWAFACGAGVRVIPLLMEKVPLHPRLSVIQSVDFTKRGKAWLRLVDTVSNVSRPENQSKRPGIHAEFEIKNGKPKRVGREYVILISMTNAPPATQQVTYEVHDRTFEDPIWSKRNRDNMFSTWMSSYGDVLLSATMSTPSGRSVVSTTLFQALRISHGQDQGQPIQTALRYIEEH